MSPELEVVDAPTPELLDAMLTSAFVEFSGFRRGGSIRSAQAALTRVPTLFVAGLTRVSTGAVLFVGHRQDPQSKRVEIASLTATSGLPIDDVVVEGLPAFVRHLQDRSSATLSMTWMPARLADPAATKLGATVICRAAPPVVLNGRSTVDSLIASSTGGRSFAPSPRRTASQLVRLRPLGLDEVVWAHQFEMGLGAAGRFGGRVVGATEYERHLWSDVWGQYVVERRDGARIGMAAIFGVDLASGSASAAIYLDPDQIGRGHGPEAMLQLADICFIDIGVSRIEGTSTTPALAQFRSAVDRGLISAYATITASRHQHGSLVDEVLWTISRATWDHYRARRSSQPTAAEASTLEKAIAQAGGSLDHVDPREPLLRQLELDSLGLFELAELLQVDGLLDDPDLMSLTQAELEARVRVLRRGASGR
jgi:hypothetical protein